MYKDQPISIYVIYLFYALQISVKLGSKLGQKLTTFSNLWASAPTELQFSIIFFTDMYQPTDKQNGSRDFFIFNYFLNNLLLSVSMQNTLSKLVELWQ